MAAGGPSEARSGSADLSVFGSFAVISLIPCGDAGNSTGPVEGCGQGI